MQANACATSRCFASGKTCFAAALWSLSTNSPLSQQLQSDSDELRRRMARAEGSSLEQDRRACEACICVICGFSK